MGICDDRYVYWFNKKLTITLYNVAYVGIL